MKTLTIHHAIRTCSLPLALMLFVAASMVPMAGCGPDNSTEKLEPVEMSPEQMAEEAAPVEDSGA
ncbi:hypothetical protein [Allorhodopirellula solitaria]|uniref:Secreted protein n=1 Tax=Allorhodopirellula solitaria TaxID=2527987 RepID=A0A5C5WXG6_9BACT|nr:hypothetical protein [Allorhodopirellula solitaria]TWT55654.1 hypothetical protein CA85_48480 [Allorhodopirellula solitaria]